MATVTIDGKEYSLEDLSDNAKGQLNALRVCDGKIQNLQREIAIIQTARATYAKGLAANLPAEEGEAQSS
ncbi:MAG: DUF6447 family protein [Gammaproteobacteria bacterium]|jgi:hypothetical protein